MNIYKPQFSSAQVAKAAGMADATFRFHLRSGKWRIIGSMGAQERGRNGQAHQFTIYDALGFALARELMECGVDPKEAFDRAMLDYAHSGDEGREPGGVYDITEHGVTFYVFNPGVPHGRILAQRSVNDPLEFLLPMFHNRVHRAIVIDLTSLRDRVFRALGLDARDYE